MTPFLFSNSTTKSWHFCKRAFYNAALREGRGVEGQYVEEDLLFGTLVHEGLPLIWQQDPTAPFVIRELRRTLETTFLQDAAWEAGLTPEAREAKAQEWGRLLEGMLAGIQRTMLPALQQDYTLVSAEGDAVRWLPWSGTRQVGLIAKPDTLLYPKESPEVGAEEEPLMPPLPGLGYLEWKTLAAPNPAWFRGWIRNPQAWTGAMCVKASVGLEIEWFRVCGLVKGSEATHVDGVRRRISPWCWAYRLAPDLPSKVVEDVTTEDGARWKAEYTSAKGWARVSTDLFPGGVAAWAMAMPEALVQAQFVLTEPDVVEWELAEEWLENQREIVEAAEDLRLTPEAWETRCPRSLEKCETGSYGRPCGFKRLCHDPEVAAEPLTVYRPRRPHHALEEAQ